MSQRIYICFLNLPRQKNVKFFLSSHDSTPLWSIMIISSKSKSLVAAKHLKSKGHNRKIHSGFIVAGAASITLQCPLMSALIEGNSRPQESNEMWSGYLIANLKGVYDWVGAKITIAWVTACPGRRPCSGTNRENKLCWWNPPNALRRTLRKSFLREKKCNDIIAKWHFQSLIKPDIEKLLLFFLQ